LELSEFEKAVEKALEKVPEEFRDILEREDIPVLARENVPDALQKQYKGSLLFGLFTGVSYNRLPTFNFQTEPTRIELYKESFEKAFNNPGEIEEQIVKTVIHEIGHYFGFSEKELRRYNL
jgi:predicted Zn-dependent protease with MMP-like domain